VAVEQTLRASAATNPSDRAVCLTAFGAGVSMLLMEGYVRFTESDAHNGT
jgi:hypothetical protein